jgi:hypothetical protein
MIISYLLSTFALLKVVSQDDRANLLYLIRLSLRAVSLKIHLFLDAGFAKDMMTSDAAISSPGSNLPRISRLRRRAEIDLDSFSGVNSGISVISISLMIAIQRICRRSGRRARWGAFAVYAAQDDSPMAFT